MAKIKSILFLGGGELGKEVVLWAKRIGFFCIVNDRKEDAPGKELADFKLNYDSTDKEGLGRWVRDNNQSYNIRYCYCGSDFGLKTAAVIHELLGLPHSSFSAIENSLSKSRMKKIWQEKGINCPLSVTANSAAEAMAAADKLGFPLVIKPAVASGSQGVRFVAHEEELTFAFADAAGYSFNKEVVVEQFIEGSHHDINGLFWDGKFIPCGIGDRFFTKPPFFVPHHGYFPTDLPRQSQNDLYDLLRGAAAAIGITFGPVKADTVIKNGQPFVYEVANRFHGDIFTARTMGFLREKNPIYKFLSAIFSGEFDFQPIDCRGMVGGWKTVFDNFNNLNKDSLVGFWQKNLPSAGIKSVRNNDEIVGLAWSWAQNRDQINQILKI